jgi:hypothetical protein
LEYLEEIKNDYDWFEENKGNFDDEDDASLLIFDEWPEMEVLEVFDDSREKGAETWLEVGEPNEEYSRYGNWKMEATTLSY